MAKSKKKDLVISNSEDFDQQEYDTAVGKLIRQYIRCADGQTCQAVRTERGWY